MATNKERYQIAEQAIRDLASDASVTQMDNIRNLENLQELIEKLIGNLEVSAEEHGGE